MNLNQKITSNLQSLFLDNFKKIQHPPLSHWLDLLESENPDAFCFNEQKITKLYDESVIANFKRAKENKELLKSYEKAIRLDFDEANLINAFSKDLVSSFEIMKSQIKKVEDSKLQIILLTYDYEPYAWLSGFGEGNYPILEKPAYFDFNHRKDFFEILGRIDYSKVWSNLIELDECLEEAEIDDEIFGTEFYQSLRSAYIYKTYLLLNEAFERNKAELFKGLDIKKPLFVYGHEHDCEKINVFCYE